MIRRDYILRMIQEFIQALARISALKKGAKWGEAAGIVDEEFDRLVGAGAQTVARLSETELLAKLMQGEPTQIIRQKILLLTTLLKEAGDLAVANGEPEESRLCYLKGLHLLLDTLACNDAAECPEFVPKVEVFVEALQDSPLPARTHARLMQHYEQSGQFGKAEDAYFALLDQQPDNPEILNFGILFYGRLGGQSDAALEEGNLPRSELAASLAVLRQRQGAIAR